jgi:hypothetical protein
MHENRISATTELLVLAAHVMEDAVAALPEPHQLALQKALNRGRRLEQRIQFNGTPQGQLLLVNGCTAGELVALAAPMMLDA